MGSLKVSLQRQYKKRLAAPVKCSNWCLRAIPQDGCNLRRSLLFASQGSLSSPRFTPDAGTGTLPFCCFSRRKSALIWNNLLSFAGNPILVFLLVFRSIPGCLLP